ncbi:ArsR/SmtB family transcription factor [Mycobacterium haemophilum]|uniref:HTH-type transcriptional repressor SmtB n=1 Tax=Mycobacterium haemophilum TaxID=29311 RepID=A0A0I9V2B0_9MYCO|nr:metalloregulator ArsR/SmtB family transcription factor [Mycobacterium haemophilum]KLO30308.1 ArsR family transcriptional regulator [Mycobacterium haemophilum]KLO37351.1 ArsR family transcriptional regulator [Mycobacterium haemophilum]KLO43900.1 ArsR family transcriptional regulator [Mycobacterium haemophilum]KLO49681.1 ArsR family transcriptional regulator [Mycobacterium haemophilum]
MVTSPSTSTTADHPSATVTADLSSGLVGGHEHGADGISRLAEYPAPPPREILDAAGELLRALAAPVRIAIVLQLRESQRCVHELVDALGVPQPLVSQHLKILKAAEVVAGERSGREVLYRLADHHLAHIVVDAVAHAGEDPLSDEAERRR